MEEDVCEFFALRLSISSMAGIKNASCKSEGVSKELSYLFYSCLALGSGVILI